jgi:hypothetical protein
MAISEHKAPDARGNCAGCQRLCTCSNLNTIHMGSRVFSLPCNKTTFRQAEHPGPPYPGSSLSTESWGSQLSHQSLPLLQLTPSNWGCSYSKGKGSPWVIQRETLGQSRAAQEEAKTVGWVVRTEALGRGARSPCHLQERRVYSKDREPNHPIENAIHSFRAEVLNFEYIPESPGKLVQQKDSRPNHWWFQENMPYVTLANMTSARRSWWQYAPLIWRELNFTSGVTTAVWSWEQYVMTLN